MIKFCTSGASETAVRNDDIVFQAIEQVGRVLAPAGEFVFFLSGV
ncbi:MAG: hypothetical protein QNJ74_09650 [Trichodesmium sp. MO_231.B1]|nr:hypothetical protein [Trichodesmium sp. MO_231.B1]